MNTALTYSIIAHLKAELPEVGGRVFWVYDGMDVDGIETPHIRVDPMIVTNAPTNAGRYDYAEVYAWQIGVFARSEAEKQSLSYAAAQALRQRSIPLFNTRANPVETTDKTFVANVTAITPVHQERVEGESFAHRAYLDVEVAIYRRNYDGLNFYQ